MIIWYIFLFVVCVSLATLIFMAMYRVSKYKKEMQENAEIQARNEQDSGTVVSLLRGEFRAIRIANEGDSSRRMDLLNLSTAIQKLNRGETVEKSTILFLLSRLEGTEKLIETIKGAGA